MTLNCSCPTNALNKRVRRWTLLEICRRKNSQPIISRRMRTINFHSNPLRIFPLNIKWPKFKQFLAYVPLKLTKYWVTKSEKIKQLMYYTYLRTKKRRVCFEGSIFMKLINSSVDLNLGKWLHPVASMLVVTMSYCEMQQENQYQSNFQGQEA